VITMTIHRLTVRLALAALLLGALALALALNRADGASADPTPQAPPAQFLPDPTSTADPADVFAILDRAASPADLRNDALDDFGAHNNWADVDGSRWLTTIAAGDVWLTPTHDGRICLSLATPKTTATSCDTLARAATIGVVMETDGQLIGVVPDGTTSATRASGPSATTLTPTAGVWTDATGPGALTITGDAGTYQLPIA
jgi:hypothetical protein